MRGGVPELSRCGAEDVGTQQALCRHGRGCALGLAWQRGPEGMGHPQSWLRDLPARMSCVPGLSRAVPRLCEPLCPHPLLLAPQEASLGDEGGR